MGWGGGPPSRNLRAEPLHRAIRIASCEIPSEIGLRLYWFRPNVPMPLSQMQMNSIAPVAEEIYVGAPAAE
jgi:hypothetical protein